MNYRSPVLFEKLLIQKSRGLASPRSLTPHHPRATVPKLSAREREREREKKEKKKKKKKKKTSEIREQDEDLVQGFAASPDGYWSCSR